MIRPVKAGSQAGPWLVADVGGTNARFGWVDVGHTVVQQVRTLPVAAFAGPAEAAAAYLEGLPRGSDGSRPSPERAALALATTLNGDQVAFTNSAWCFSRAGLQHSLRVRQLLLLNDFEALALSLPRLGAEQLQAVGPPPPPPPPFATKAVIGPGTGLGVGAVAHSAQGWLALPSEGGHVTLAACDDLEAELLRLVRRQHPHVSAERLLSGTGLPLLHQTRALLVGLPAPALSASQVVDLGAASNPDAACRETLELFCALLGSFAGNAALTLGARGGVYIGGGIVPRMQALFMASRFRERFEAKGRFQAYLQAIPTALVTDTLAALTGALLALEQSSA